MAPKKIARLRTLPELGPAVARLRIEVMMHVHSRLASGYMP
jgi:hypothetical protein